MNVEPSVAQTWKDQGQFREPMLRDRCHRIAHRRITHRMMAGHDDDSVVMTQGRSTLSDLLQAIPSE